MGGVYTGRCFFMLLGKDWKDSCTDMLASLDWLNVKNMRAWCCVRTMRRFMDHPSQAPHTWDILNLNNDPLQNVRYRALKMNWTKFTPWARSSYVYQAVAIYNELGLHGRGFEDYQEMKDQVKSNIISLYGNKNIK